MQHRIVYSEPGNGIRRTMIFDDERPHEVVIQIEQVVDEIMPGIARLRENHRTGGDLRHLARIPFVHGEHLLRADDDELKHWLNKSDNREFRIWPGRV